MHVEFATFVESALDDFAVSIDALDIPFSSADIRAVLPKALPVDVEDTPREIDWTITTNIGFRLTSLLNKRGAGERSCDVHAIVVPLVEVLNQRQLVSPMFELQISEAGHLNARPTVFFQKEFFAEIERLGIDVLFANVPFIVMRSGSSVSVEMFDIDWDDVLARAGRSGNEDIQRLTTAAKFETSSASDRLMLLALLADRELDVEPYMCGLYGRSNVPWYLQRFHADQLRCNQISTTWQEDDEGEVDPRVSEVLEQCLDLILCFRHVFFSARRSRRPERVLLHLLLCVQGFYRCYNLPQCRSMLERGGPEARRLLAMSQILRELLLRAFPTPCGA